MKKRDDMKERERLNFLIFIREQNMSMDSKIKLVPRSVPWPQICFVFENEYTCDIRLRLPQFSGWFYVRERYISSK